MDHTVAFRLIISQAHDTSGHKENQKTSILKTKPKSEFTRVSSRIVAEIRNLENVLLDSQKAYLSFISLLPSDNQMTDLERDQFDANAQQIITDCSKLVQDLKFETLQKDDSSQKGEHEKIVVYLIKQYLKKVCDIYSNQRAVRMKCKLEAPKLTKLSVNPNITTDLYYKDKPQKDWVNEDKPSENEMQMFETENEQLFNEMNDLSQTVNQVESKVTKLAELQRIITEKVLEQEVNVESMMRSTFATTENIRDANKQIREATQGSAGLRVMILLFLIVMSFTLLFLNWYS